MKWTVVFKVAFLLVSITANNVNAFECKSIDACIALIPEAEGKVWGSGTADKHVLSKLKSFGRDALIPLSKLTSEDDPNRRAVADYLISDIEDLNEGDFPIIYEVIQNNFKFKQRGGWSYGALGYVGGDKAGKYLISELKRVQSSDNSIGTALRRLGVKGLPFIIEGLRCFESCDKNEFRGFNNIFRPIYGIQTLDDKSAMQLFGIAKNEKIDIHARKSAMSIIGSITKNSELARKINIYAEDYPEFLYSAFTSLKSMKSPLAAKILVNQLSFNRSVPSFSVSKEYYRFNNNRSILFDLSESGISANRVGSEIVPYLSSALWEDRVHSAITLGYIGYLPATPNLLKLLSNKVDWQQTYAAIKALHMLGDKEIIPDIEVVAKSHWYHPLKEYAEKVVVSMKANEPSEKLYHNTHFSFKFFDYGSLREENHRCDRSDYTEVLEPFKLKQYRADSKTLNDFTYKNPECANKEYSNYYHDYCSTTRSIVLPAFIAKYDDKWLAGDDRGEWGGELMLFEKDKAPKSLLNENIEDVYVIGEYAYVISGLAHMSSNTGLIYRIKEVDSEYLIEPFYRLPGAPRSSWKTGDDSILINTESGAVIFNPENGLKMAECTTK